MFELKCCYHMIYTGKFQASLKSIFLQVIHAVIVKLHLI